MADWLLTAVFKYRPGMQGMDLAADVAAPCCGMVSGPCHSCDRRSIRLDRAGHDGGEPEGLTPGDMVKILHVQRKFESLKSGELPEDNESSFLPPRLSEPTNLSRPATCPDQSRKVLAGVHFLFGCGCALRMLLISAIAC